VVVGIDNINRLNRQRRLGAGLSTMACVFFGQLPFSNEDLMVTAPLLLFTQAVIACARADDATRLIPIVSPTVRAAALIPAFVLIDRCRSSVP
jgi:hypothetical protein